MRLEIYGPNSGDALRDWPLEFLGSKVRDIPDLVLGRGRSVPFGVGAWQPCCLGRPIQKEQRVFLSIPLVFPFFFLSSPQPSHPSFGDTMPLSAFPRIFISCPCVEARDTVAKAKKRQSQIESAESQRIEEEEEEGKTFNPRSARATFSLFPLDHLLYCDDCGQIRCPRCVNEEIVCYFCPSCLFEVPTATVKTEGNR